jgi:uncharacterized integral membrane protein
MKKPKIIAVLIVGLLIVIVLTLNSDPVPVKCPFKRIEARAFIMYFIFYVLGDSSVFIGMLWRKI